MSAFPDFENPMDLFNAWFDEAREANDKYFDAVSFATVDEEGLPDVRIVLLRRIVEEGFVVFSNYESAKGRQALGGGKAALCLYIRPLDRQVRIRGTVEKADAAISDDYFSTRPRDSQVGAWASRQSEAIASRKELEDRFAEFDARFEGKPVPRPPHWGGFLVRPLSIEFWKEGAWRLHDRLLYVRQGNGAWERQVLSP